MFDFHTHTYASDGVLGFAELARRCRVAGYTGLVISDHGDHGNLESALGQLVRFCATANRSYDGLDILPGCELTHVPPPLTAEVTRKARRLGAAVVLVHGETITEPVEPGTNRAAIAAGVDVLAHPGLISREDAALAAKRGVRLEISGRKGHGLANGHVFRLARETGALLCYGSDGHVPGEYLEKKNALMILRGAGMSAAEAEDLLQANAAFFRQKLAKFRKG